MTAGAYTYRKVYFVHRGARVRRRNLSGSRSLLPGPLAYYEFASYEPMRDRANIMGSVLRILQ